MPPPRRSRTFRLPLVAGLFLLGCSPDSGAGTEQPTWPEGLPVEAVEDVDCPVEDCLVVEESSTYCSIDPHSLLEGAVFSTKSRLTISKGVYPVTGRSELTGLSVVLETASGTARLTPAGGGARVRIKPDQSDEDGNLYQPERIELDGPYRGDGLALDRFFLRTPRWPHLQFRLGDPEDLFWFYWAGRNVFIRTQGTSDLFPGLSDQIILYAPCSMRGQPDETFSFELVDGSVLDLGVRAVSGSRELGYYTGRLLSMHGRLPGEELDVRDPSKLAFFGSTRSWAEMAIPTLAVRTADSGPSCGLIFDSSAWDTAAAVDGYIAYRMTCDQRRGEPLPLAKVSYPQRYTLP